MRSVGELSKVCPQVVNCPYLARIGRLDNSWSVNKPAPAITKWTSACDKRSARLISVNSNNIVMWVQHNNAD